ncbi:MAG: histidine kinase [Oscillospiraceae bacterium]|nr:histidine kinase [Oscillospiraceae bacterium]
MSKINPSLVFNALNITGLSLLFVSWLQTADTLGFILLMFVSIMYITRYRFRHSKIRWTIFIDIAVILALLPLQLIYQAELFTGFALFGAMFFGFYPVATLLGVLFIMFDLPIFILTVCLTLLGLILNFWKKERKLRFSQRDYYSKKNHELENLQSELTAALAEVERMSIIAERSRISANIHDNAGHEIVSAYIALQTVRKLAEKNPTKAFELFDKSMDKLNAGVGKMRDAVHNMSVVSFMGVDRIKEICTSYEKAPVSFKATGDMTGVTVNVWHVLEAVLSESLTNAMKHANPTEIMVELDVTKHLVRLLFENDGVIKKDEAPGSGLRNLRYRAVTVGGNLTVKKTDRFKLVCVIPIS